MLHGDISNQSDLIIGVRIEDTLFNLPDNNIFDRLKSKIAGYNVSETDEKVLGLINYILRSTDYSLKLIISEEVFNPVMRRRLSKLGGLDELVLPVKSINEVSMLLLTGELSYYVDENEERRNCIISKYVLNFKEFNRFLIRHKKR